MKYFELFDLEEKYNIDIAELKRSYLLKQTKFHPDQAKNNAEKEEFLSKSMLINTAYQTLADDYKRAVYLLKSRGGQITEDRAKNALNKKDLEKIWVDNESIDNTKDLEALKSIEQEKIVEKKKLINNLSVAFAANQLQNALELTIKLKYLTNLVKNVSLKIKDANS